MKRTLQTFQTLQTYGRRLRTELVAAATALVLVSLFALIVMPPGQAQNPPPPTSSAPPEQTPTLSPPSGQPLAPSVQPAPTVQPAPSQPVLAPELPSVGQEGIQLPGQNLGSDPGSSILISTPPVFPVSPEQYVFNPENRRDPFEPYKGIVPISKTVGPNGVVVPVITDPLLMYEIEDYSIVGILWNVKIAKVMVKEPKGGVFVLAKGARLGRRNGVIHEIREGGVIIKEVFDTEAGKKVEYKSLALKR